MPLAKAVSEGIRDKECDWFALQERPPVPYIYMPEKHPVQETVSALKSDQSLKTTIKEDAELRTTSPHLALWYAQGFFQGTALDAIKKQGTFKAYTETIEAYVEQREAVKQAKATLALLTAPAKEGKKASENASAK